MDEEGNEVDVIEVDDEGNDCCLENGSDDCCLEDNSDDDGDQDECKYPIIV